MPTKSQWTVRFALTRAFVSAVVIALSLTTGTAQATTTTNGGVAYDTQCFQSGVPMPPDMGTSYWKYITNKNGNGVLMPEQTFTTPAGRRAIFFYESLPNSAVFDGGQGPNPPGICALNMLLDGGTGGEIADAGEINVLCQGVNGKTCFWRWPSEPPVVFDVSNPLYFCNTTELVNGTQQFAEPDGKQCVLQGQNPRISSRFSDQYAKDGAFSGTGDPAHCNVNSPNRPWAGTGLGCGRVFAGGYGEVDTVAAGDLACSACHAGENMIINHPGTATDFESLITNKNAYFPTIGTTCVPGNCPHWPDPLVPAPGGGDLLFPAFNPGPSSYTETGGGSQCLACHGQQPDATCTANHTCGGRLPIVSADLFSNSLNPGGYCDTVLTSAVTRTTTNPYSLNPSLGCGADQSCLGEMPLFVSSPADYPGTDAFTNERLNVDCKSTALRISCGTKSAIPPFGPDTDFSGGAEKTRLVTINLSGLVNPAPMAVYQSQHYASPFSYTIPGFAPGSIHLIRLHFAETNPNNQAPNRRKFSVAINGTTAISNLDLFATVGFQHGYIKEFSLPANSSGKYVLSFTASLDSATISGIEVL
jgi:hypothetical protein